MTPESYRTFSDAASGVELAYRECGSAGGDPVLFLHGFASFSRMWEPMMPFLPRERRYIAPDIPPFGYSAGTGGRRFSLYDQAEILRRFIIGKGLFRLTLAGLDTGADLALALLDSPEIRARAVGLILINCTAAKQNRPEFISAIASVPYLGNPLLRFAHSKPVTRMMLHYAYKDRNSVTQETVDEYSEMLALPGKLRDIISAARNYSPYAGLPKRETFIPSLLVRGADSSETSPDDLNRLAAIFNPSFIRTVQGAAHMPPEESPEECAKIITSFLSGAMMPATPETPQTKNVFSPAKLPHSTQTMKLTRLFDKLDPQALLVLGILKALQIFRKLGITAESHGWRKVTSIFVKNEYSKFMLAAFRLSYCAPLGVPSGKSDARKILVERLSSFMQTHGDLWTMEPGLFSVTRKKIMFHDIIEAHADATGCLISLVPHLDPAFPPPDEFRLPEQIEFIMLHVMNVYNALRYVPSAQRTRRIRRNLGKWAARHTGLNIPLRMKLNGLVDRLMSAMFVYCEELPEKAGRKRFAMPNLHRFRHPGWGMLCLVARFSPDYSEVDLWCQFNHVATDGAPMQELLNELKRTWGTAGPPVYPALEQKISVPDRMYCGDGVFRARVFADFSHLLEIRKRLNRDFINTMGGPASLGSILMWGFSGHEFFKNKKILLPVDEGVCDGERELGLLIIRPGVFKDTQGTRFLDFLAFQREFNRRLAAIHSGNSESHEFLALCTMLHPFFYHIAHKLADETLHEIIGTVGLSIIRDSDMFIAPLTDFQINGFMSLGSVSVPTENGRTAGSFCACGSRQQIRSYLEALTAFLDAPERIIGLPE